MRSRNPRRVLHGLELGSRGRRIGRVAVVQFAQIGKDAELGADGVQKRRPWQSNKGGLAVHLRQTMVRAVLHAVAGFFIAAAHVVIGVALIMARHRRSRRRRSALRTRRAYRQQAERQSEEGRKHQTH